jgi:hypothetical protein
MKSNSEESEQFVSKRPVDPFADYPSISLQGTRAVRFEGGY